MGIGFPAVVVVLVVEAVMTGCALVNQPPRLTLSSFLASFLSHSSATISERSKAMSVALAVLTRSS